MKQNIFFLLSLCIVLFSCSGDSDDPIKEVEKPPVETTDPFITLKKSNVDFTNEGGEEAIVIESNVTWTAKSSDSWCTVSPTSGNKSTESIKISADENETYDDRDCTITIEGEGVTKTITVIQSQENAIILSEKTFDISSNSQTLEIELKTNVDFEVIIANDAKDWISYIGTRALRTEVLLLEVSSNENEKARSAEVFIKNKNLQDTLIINQKGNEPGVYWVDKMGTLDTMLTQTQKDTITTMIVKGEINKADFDVMKFQMPQLRYLDLKDVKCEDDKIPYAALSHNINISKISLPKSITKIEGYAFANCKELSGSLDLPDGLIIIGERAFYDCSGLSGSLTLPDGVILIGERAFQNCSGFTGSLTLPDELKTIEVAVFYNCSGFTGTLSLPDGLISIRDGAFDFCSGFTGSLKLPEGLTEIGVLAFSGCSGFTGSLYLPDGLTTIKSYAFYACSGFTGINLPDKLSRIEVGVFWLCSGLTGVLTLPDGLETIENVAFASCNNLTGLVLGKNVTTIHEGAFRYCSNITGDVVFPATLTSTRNESFYGCNKVDAFQFPHTTPLGYYSDMLPKSVPVKVPNEAVSTYQSTPGWKEHTIIGY